ncbi:MAG: hypothetical protein KBT87_10325 [Gammaproteobacteria bacterium]|jgi:hypothetical protein|nr:hypothetical protein [Gammaproteobacteria bacterium]MBQ0775057.1 hypothetical protein [Gammaproteobacteria bacterium]
MTARYAITGIFGALISLTTCQQALATDCESPVTLGEKPAMEAYADYSDFLVAIMDFKSRSRARAEQETACPALFSAQANPEPVDPTVTYGPETLESATTRASKLKPSIYPMGSTWYKRSTSRSFALPALASAQMDQESIATHLRTLIDSPYSSRDQQLAIETLGPLPDDDGHWGQNIAERQLHDNSATKENEVQFTVERADLPYDQIITNTTINGSYIRLYVKQGAIIQTHALAYTCLGDCVWSSRNPLVTGN